MSVVSLFENWVPVLQGERVHVNGLGSGVVKKVHPSSSLVVLLDTGDLWLVDRGMVCHDTFGGAENATSRKK